MLKGEEVEEAKPVRWASLLRSGGQSLREDTSAKFLPIYLDEETGRVLRVGDDVDPDFDYLKLGGRGGGSEYVWRYLDPRARFDEKAETFWVHAGFKEALDLKTGGGE